MKTRNLLGFAFLLATLFIQNLKVNANNFFAGNYNTTNAITFVEKGITFSIFQNGEFDFYLNSQLNSVRSTYYGSNMSISFNAGYNYNAVVQYDQFGAVVQIEHTPIYYDYYGRVTAIGGININYRRGNLYRVGGLHLHYNAYGNYAYHTGYINYFNQFQVYNPHHDWFIRPYAGYHVVKTTPYRLQYSPTRYHYYNDHRYAYKTPHNYKNAYTTKRTTYQRHQGSKNYVYSNDIRSKSVASNYRPTSKSSDYSHSKGYSTKNVTYQKSEYKKSKNNRNSKNYKTNNNLTNAKNKNNYKVKTTSVEHVNSRNGQGKQSSRPVRVLPNSSNEKGSADKYASPKGNKSKRYVHRRIAS